MTKKLFLRADRVIDNTDPLKVVLLTPGGSQSHAVPCTHQYNVCENSDALLSCRLQIHP